MKSLPIRTVFAVLLIGLLALVLWLGGWVQAIVLGLFSVIAVHEMTDIFRNKDIHPWIFQKHCGQFVFWHSRHKVECKCFFQ